MPKEYIATTTKDSSSPESVRVLIIDDHTLFRKGVHLLLEKQEEIEVAGEAQDGAQGLELFASLRPDVVLLDMYLPDAYGHEIAARLKEIDPDARIIVLSAFHSEELLRDSLRAGVLGYVLKNADNDVLLDAIKRAKRNQLQLCPVVLQDVVTFFLQTNHVPQDMCLTQLTTREREIFDLVAQDLKNKSIAEQCFISVKTVEKHKSNIIRKLQLSSASELRSFAITSRYH